MSDCKLKEMLVEYVGERKDDQGCDVTVDDIAEVFAEEFPEFLLAIAEENWIRGYSQGVHDKKYMNNLTETKIAEGD